MSFAKVALIAAGLSFAMVTTGAYAQDAMGDSSAVMLDKTGKMKHIKKVNAKGHAMISGKGVKLKPGTVIYRKGNDLFMLEQAKIDGELADHAKGWED